MKVMQPAVIVLSLVVVVCVLISFAAAAPVVDSGVYYFGDWHREPLLEQIHGTNWTEWRLLESAQPRFAGHLQPKVPLWGYQDESLPEVFAQKTDAAADHGLGFFFFDWYWHQGTGKFLWRPLEEGYLKSRNVNRIKFALMWANHDWVDIHPAKRTWGKLLQFPGAVDRATFDNITDYITSTYFQHPSYYRVPDLNSSSSDRVCPFFSIYELFTLLDGLGGVREAADAIAAWRNRAAAAGIPCIHLNAIDWGLKPYAERANDIIGHLGVNSVTSYCFIHNVAPPTFPVTRYQYMVNQTQLYWQHASETFAVPYLPHVSVAWDSSPRAVQTDVYENVGYPFMPVFSATQAELREALQAAAEFSRKQCADKHDWCAVTINAWNEWTEGSYLEPDTVHKYEYLQAVKDVFGPV
eukprot:TRINITY_DN1635_c0_g1_i1.p1 TRINITY_DN1635_c0_g1~~TRINITY_DN1635_c0_g1_i1.p1  ORF type:complete len:419 (-),score=77.03 TRINITY_DN1635_c0_g1_i1:204-1433(-)